MIHEWERSNYKLRFLSIYGDPVNLPFYLALFHQLYLSLSSADQTAEDDLPLNIADSQKR